MMEVTDEMVIKAVHAYQDEEIRVFGEVRTPNNGTRHRAMRAALDAALSHAAGQDGELCRAAPAGGEPAAYRITDGEGSYEYRDELPDQRSIEWSARYGRKWEPLYTRPQVSAPAGSGEVDGWKKWPIINRLQMQANDCEDAADENSDAVIMPLQLKALAADLREAAALLRKLQQGAE